MLLAESTKHGAGILLYGDYKDLDSLHETIHYLSKGVPLGDEFDDLVLGLAYDVRKAKEDQRETIFVKTEYEEELKYKGEKILWPTFLLQMVLLRWSAAYHPTNRNIQANLYRLEACTEKALLKSDYDTARKVLEWYERFGGLPSGYADQFIVIANKEFITYSDNGKKRFKNLPNILQMLHPSSSEYEEFEYEIKTKGIEIPYPYKELKVEIEFPDFEW